MVRLVAVATGVLAATLIATPSLAQAASPIGSWTRDDGRVYRWAPLAGGSWARYSMTTHRTSTNTCRYHPLGKGIYRVDSLQWDSGCKPFWANGNQTHRAPAQAAPTATTDTKPPVVRALYSQGKVGGITSLRYIVTDDSGKTWDEFLLYRDGLVVRRYKTPLGPAVKGRMYGYKLQQTPAAFRGTFAFCVISHDAAGHTSVASCAPVTIR